MRGFSILLWLLVTGLMFYSAWRFKAPEIEKDITMRTSERVASAGGADIAIDVDGRHVNLRGYAQSQAAKSNLLKTADETYGALGPVDGLVLPRAPAKLFISATRGAQGVTLTGVVGSDAEREALVTQAKAAGLGPIANDIEVAEGQISWAENAGVGFAQLSNLVDGHLYVSEDQLAISGAAPNAEVEAAANALGNEWTAFVSGPAQEDPRIAELQGVVSERDKQIEDLGHQITGMNSQIEAEKAAVAAQNSMLAENANAMNANAEQIAELQAQLADKSSAASSMNTELVTAAATIAALNAKLGDSEESLRKQLEEKEAARLALEKELARIGNGVAAIEGERSSLAKELAAAQAETAELETRFSSLNAAKLTTDTTKIERVTELNSQLARANAKIDRLNAEAATLVANNTQSTDEIKALKERIATNHAALAKAKTEIASREIELQTSFKATASANTLMQTLEADLAEAQANATASTTELKAELAAKTTEAAEAATQVATLEAQVATLTTDLETAQATATASTTELKAELAAKTTEAAEAATQVATLEAQVATLTTDLETLTTDLETAQSNATASVTDLQAELAAKTTEAAEASAKVATLEPDLEATRTNLEQIGAEKTDLEAKLAATSTERDQARTLADQGQAEIAVLMARLSDADKVKAQIPPLQATIKERDATIAALNARLSDTPNTEPDDATIIAQCNETATELLTDGQINFETNSAVVRANSVPLLERITGVVLACQNERTSVLVGGHTDSSGDTASNQTLSEARANAIRDYLIERGVNEDVLAAEGFGDTKPTADNATQEGRAANRRITFEWSSR